jgi:sugar phosphate isomerase/epimerase
MAFDLGTSLVLTSAGTLPRKEDAPRREAFTHAVRELGGRADHRGVRLALETGAEPADELNAFLVDLGSPSLGVSIDPSRGLQANIAPVASVRTLAEWVAHAYAGDAPGFARVQGSVRRGFDAPARALDWEEYLGALEEIGYRGFLTVWPVPGQPAALQFTAVCDRLGQLS